MFTRISVSLIACALLGPWQLTDGKDLPEYTAIESAKHIGETAMVTDKVESVSQTKAGNVFLNLGGRHPNQAFTVFIPAANVSAFKDVKVYDGKIITVSGKIEEHDGKPEIIVKSPSQITSKVDDLSGAAASSSPAAAPAEPR